MGHFILKVSSVVALLATGAIGFPASAGVVYGFEGLTPGTLNGQDGWTSISGSGSLGVVTGSGGNTSQVVTTSVASGVNEFSRALGSGLGLSATGSAVMEVDVQWQVPSVSSRNGGAWFALGHDSSDAGTTIVGSELGPWLGMQHGFSGTGIYLREAGGGTEFFASLLPGIDDGDWLRLRLEIDFSANAGDGAGSVSVMNLTDGAAVFSGVPTLQLVNLQIQSMAIEARNPEDWDAMFIRVDREFEDPMALDNLRVIPEPTSAALFAMGALVLVRRRRR